MSTALDTRPRSALAELSLTNGRELLRDGKTMFFVLLFPLFFLGLFGFISSTADAGAAEPVVGVVESSGSAAVVDALEEKGISARAVPASVSTATVTEEGINALVTLEAGSAGVVLNADDQPAWRGIVDAISSTGISKAVIDTAYSDGSVPLDPLRTSLASIMMVSFVSLALLGTAVPVVALRGKGTLRLLGTTPIRRSTFILSQTPSRFALGLVQAAIVIGVTFWLGYVSIENLPRLIGTAVIGLVMLFALGYLIGSRASNAEVTTTVVSLVIPVALMLSGSVIPLSVFPEAVAGVVAWLPTTVLADALAVDLVGAQGTFDVFVAWGLMAAVAAAAALLAATLFRWDRKENR